MCIRDRLRPLQKVPDVPQVHSRAEAGPQALGRQPELEVIVPRRDLKCGGEPVLPEKVCDPGLSLADGRAEDQR